jgi:hypothetical protein
LSAISIYDYEEPITIRFKKITAAGDRVQVTNFISMPRIVEIAATDCLFINLIYKAMKTKQIKDLVVIKSTEKQITVTAKRLLAMKGWVSITPNHPRETLAALSLELLKECTRREGIIEFLNERVEAKEKRIEDLCFRIGLEESKCKVIAWHNRR